MRLRPTRCAVVCSLSALSVAAVSCGDRPTDSVPETYSLYVGQAATKGGSARLAAYSVDGRGAVHAVQGSPYELPTDTEPHEIAVDPSGRFIYLATTRKSGAPLLYPFQRDANTGALSAGSPFRAYRSASYYAPVIDASGRFLYTSDPIEEALFGFRVASANGTLSPLDAGGTSAALNNVYGLATTPSGFLYATSTPLRIPNDPQRGFVLAYHIEDSGALRSVAEPIQAGEDTHIPVVHPNGRFLYAPNAGSDDISGYVIEATSGMLTPLPGAPFSAGSGVVALAFDPAGRYLYAVNRDDRSVSAFSVDTRSGELRLAGPAVDGPGTTQASIVVGPNGRFVHVVGGEDGSLWTYAVDVGSGRLALVPNGQLTIPSGPGALAAAPAR